MHERDARRNPDYKSTLVDCRARIADRDEAEDEVEEWDKGRNYVECCQRTASTPTLIRHERTVVVVVAQHITVT